MHQIDDEFFSNQTKDPQEFQFQLRDREREREREKLRSGQGKTLPLGDYRIEYGYPNK